MKTSNITKSALALALGLCASGAWAATVTTVSETFESYDVGTGISGLTTSNVTWSAGADDASSVVAGKKLEIDTGADAVTATITDATGFNAAYGESVRPTFKATVSFTPATTAPTIDDTNNDLKFALYALAGATTNLYVIGQGGTPVDTEITLDDTSEKALIVTFEANNQFTVKYGNSAVKGPYTFKNGSGIAKLELSGNGTVDNIEFAYDNPTWEDFLGNTIATDTYGIDSLAELKNFQQGVAKGLPTAGKTFKLTADVALDAAWPGIGLQNGKDEVTTAAFDEGAFRGIFDGQNYTISGFQMVGVAGNPANNGKGLDYCGFFNSTYGATIRNLKIQYAGGLFATDTTSATEECGATFVGVAKGSTLQNLTSLPKDASTGVSCSKGIGGIVGYLTTSSTVEYCTNNVSLTSLAGNKVGGIAMIRQGDTGTSTIANCQNNGTIAESSNNQYGGIVGYVDGSLNISDCENTASCRMLLNNKGKITVSGVNKGHANKLSYYANQSDSQYKVANINFATISGNVATFVADSALAAGNTYKVMAAGATATYNFTAAGTIAFDTALATPTWAVTGSSDINLTDATSGTVKTYTATLKGYAGSDTPTFDDSSEYAISAAEATYLNTVVAAAGGKSAVEAVLDDMTVDEFKDAALLNENITAEGYAARSYSFDVTGIKRITEDDVAKVQVSVTLVRNYALKENEADAPINGTLYLYSSSDGGKTWDAGDSTGVTNANFGSANVATFKFAASGKGKVFKAEIK